MKHDFEKRIMKCSFLLFSLRLTRYSGSSTIQCTLCEIAVVGELILVISD